MQNQNRNITIDFFLVPFRMHAKRFNAHYLFMCITFVTFTTLGVRSSLNFKNSCLVATSSIFGIFAICWLEIILSDYLIKMKTDLVHDTMSSCQDTIWCNDRATAKWWIVPFVSDIDLPWNAVLNSFLASNDSCCIWLFVGFMTQKAKRSCLPISDDIWSPLSLRIQYGGK